MTALATPVFTRMVARSLEKNLPLNVHFDLTYRCNERCVHCYLDHEDYGELTTGEVLHALEEMAEAGTLFLTFSGGEIFLRKDFFTLLEAARRLHFDLNLKTNGLLVTAERAARLKELGVAKIQISVYSAEPRIHDAITKVSGSHARSLEAVRFLKACGLSVKIACPLMKQNAGGYAAVLQLAEELGVPCVLDMTITPKMDGDRSLLALRNQESELLPILQNAKLNPLPETSPGPVEQGGCYDNIPCSAGHNSCYISPYGDVYPCVQMPLPTGNIRQAAFRQIWYGSKEMGRVRAVRESSLRICPTCEIRRYCHRCPGLAYLEDGDITGPSERACELAEANARIAGISNPVSAWRALQGQKFQVVSLPIFAPPVHFVASFPARTCHES